MTNPTRIGAMMLLIALLPGAVFAQDAQRHPTEGQAQKSHMKDMSGESMGPQMMGGGMMMEGTTDMTMDMTMDMPMMSAMMGGPRPAMILKQSEALELGPNQVRDLEALQNQAKMGRESRMARMKTLHARLTEVLSGDEVDAAEYEAVLRNMADQQVAMHVQRLKIGQQALGVLSDVQRGKLGSERPMMEKMEKGEAMMMGAERMEGQRCPMAGGEGEEGRET